MQTIQVTWILPNASDNSGTVRVSGSLESGSAFTIGVTNVSYKAEDPSGNTASCEFSVTVKEESEKPVITCPPNIETTTDIAVSNIRVTWEFPNATDNSGNVTVTGSHEPGSNFTIGVTTVSYVATDPSGNTANCWFIVRIRATSKPLFDDMNGMRANVSMSKIIEELGALSDAISELTNLNVSVNESMTMAQDILELMDSGIATLKNTSAVAAQGDLNNNLLVGAVLNATDNLAKFVLRCIEPGSGPVVFDTPSIRLNLESDSVEKLANLSVMMGDGNGFRLPPAETLFADWTSYGTVNRIVKRLSRKSFQLGSMAYTNDVLSLSFTDREDNELILKVKDTKEDIGISFDGDPPKSHTDLMFEGVYHEDEDVTCFGLKFHISWLFHAVILQLESSYPLTRIQR
ncbi:hyalin-like [Ptychodera flava]|uniref:hyalin-like n=1 Tax=Ptychodera flava TaxID=63121 RepID=UPI00396A52F7